jgi:hypothetical protein
MIAFIAIVGLIIGVANMSFHQGQANPDALSSCTYRELPT